MYASANSMVRTANGALVIGGRFPLMSLQVSWDDGHSWAFYSLESRPGGNGAMVEVAPNVVMCTAPSHDLRLLVLCRPVRALTLCSVCVPTRSLRPRTRAAQGPADVGVPALQSGPARRARRYCAPDRELGLMAAG